MSEQSRPPADPVLVHGFDFEFRRYAWNHTELHDSVRVWVCADLKAELFQFGHDSWGLHMHRGNGTGRTAEEAFQKAYTSLDEKVDEMTRILNLVHEKSGLKT